MKDIKRVVLLDLYGALLTEKQYDALDMYYNQDYSLAEIASETGISRQGAMSVVRQGEKNLQEYEDKLRLASKLEDIKEIARRVRSMVLQMPRQECTDKLLSLADSLENCI